MIATQSNNAANIIAARLSGEDDDIRESMLRVVSKSVISKKKLPQELHRYSASIVKRDVADLEDEENDDTIKIELESLKKYRIIVGTCVGLGVIAQSDMNHGYFTHVLLDEAAQCIGMLMRIRLYLQYLKTERFIDKWKIHIHGVDEEPITLNMRVAELEISNFFHIVLHKKCFSARISKF